MASEVWFYCWSKCSTCRQASQTLRDLGVQFTERDFFRDQFNKRELSELCAKVSAKDLFSWASPSARKYREHRSVMGDSELLDLMLNEPRLIRRPLLLSGDNLLIGYRKEAYELFVGQH